MNRLAIFVFAVMLALSANLRAQDKPASHDHDEHSKMQGMKMSGDEEAIFARMRMTVAQMRSTIATIRDVPTRQALEANLSLWEDFLKHHESEQKASAGHAGMDHGMEGMACCKKMKSAGKDDKGAKGEKGCC